MTTWIARCAKWALLSAAFVVPMMFTDTASAGEILVVSAHPDDDIVMAAGVTSRAVSRGDTVRVVYVTNGDANGSSLGFTREDEAVAAEATLGVTEDHLMFFGYPDDNLYNVWTTTSDPSENYTSPNTGLSSTYGNRGLGHFDYHTYRHGASAPYNRPNMISDMVDVLATYLPTHIFVTSQFDVHTDHSTSYWLVQAALTEVIASHPGYNPTVHKTQIWMSSLVWPNALNAAAYFAEEPNLYERTGLVWSERESLDVPPSMQLTLYGNNPKYMAVDYHTSQEGAYQFLARFVHKDEFYWTEQPAAGNAPPVPNAGVDESVAEAAAVALDGSASFDRNGDTVSFQWTQTGGTPVVLLGATTSHPSFTAPAGLNEDALLSFELTVSDGSLTSVPDAVNVHVAAQIQLPPPGNIASLASSVTASSQNSADGQTADKAVDGFVDGYPHDDTKEWASDGEGVGAWIELTWSTPHVVSSVRLHDRPNENDQIEAGTLHFSDGSTVPVGRLPNPGAGLVVSFPPRAITSVRFTIDAVARASNIGLAEILVFEAGVDPCLGVICTASGPCHVAGTCNPATGTCSDPSAPDGTSCSDGSACTLNDACSGGTCTGLAISCNDNNACTDDTCDPAEGVCVFTNNTSPCSDGNACTTGDTCGAGACLSGTPLSCDDDNPCTDDSCNPATGCVHTNNAEACNDGNECTEGDACSNGACTGSAITCNDENSCTDDTCEPLAGCIHTNNANACDDGNACTSGDVCSAGTCTGAVITCNDNNPCTDDACDGATGCSYTNTTSTCDDGNACTSGDVCSGGVCVGSGITCTDDNPCTDDSCNPATGCVHANNSNTCDDGSVCTSGDVCGNGVCAGAAITCNDDNPCTDDTCDPTIGCLYANNTSPCNDGNACTSDDVCNGGSCHPGTPVICNDDNICTTDSCDPATGCLHTNNTNACNDGNVCTSGDVCGAGTCAGAAITCNDNNSCTDDTCNPATGCVFTNNTNACDDGNACTTNDACASGVCTGSPVPAPAAIDNSVRINKTQAGAMIVWEDTPGPYKVYRGGKGPSGPWVYNQSSMLSQSIVASPMEDTDIPLPDHFFYYLITRVSACSESSLGTDSSGHQRPNATP